MMPTRIKQRIGRFCAALLLCGWGVAWATVAAAQANPDLTSLPWMQIAIGAAIATWGGATATLGRYMAAVYEERPFRWRLEVVRDLTVSVTVGSGAYLASAWYGMGPLQLGLLLLLSGYLGVRMLNVAADRLLQVITSK